MSKLGFLGNNEDGSKNYLNLDDLMTHAVVLGRTGSGKSGLIHVIVEEVASSGIPVIVLDPKGDLTNLALSLSNKELKEWVSEDKAPEVLAKRTSDLREFGLSEESILSWKTSVNVGIITPGLPGSSYAVNLLPEIKEAKSRHDLRSQITHYVETILSLIGYPVEGLSDPRSLYLTELLYSNAIKGNSLSIEEWPSQIIQIPPNLTSFDGILTEDILPKKDRIKLASAVVAFKRQAAKWLSGSAMDLDSYLKSPNNVTVFSMRHLTFEDRQLFTSMFLANLVSWMFKEKSHSSLRALCVLDEAAGYLPPHPLNPPTKKPICSILSQGRAQGLGVLLGTQNPNDIDYKAISNIGTWFLGNLRERDIKRDLEALLVDKNVEVAEISKLIPRHFLGITKSGETTKFKVKSSLSYLKGPLDLDEIKKANSRFYKSSEGAFHKGDIIINYTVVDKHSKLYDMDVIYSTDGGNKWQRATPSKNSPSLNKVESSPAGTNNLFIWDSVSDIGLSDAEVLIHVKDIKNKGITFPPITVKNSILSTR